MTFDQTKIVVIDKIKIAKHKRFAACVTAGILCAEEGVIPTDGDLKSWGIPRDTFIAFYASKPR